MDDESIFLLGLFASGTAAGLFSRWGPLSGWAALAFPALIPPFGIWMCALFC
jgi:hypothetical protein